MTRLFILALLIISKLSVVPAQAQPAPANWTIMHYTAVDNNLEGAAFNDYYEMQSVGSSSEINIVAQLDRAEGFDTRFGDWKDTRRFVIEYVEPPAEASIEAKRAAVIDFLAANGRGDLDTLTSQAANTPDAIIHRLYTENNLGATFEQTPVQELGEVDMGDPQSLTDFIVWSVQNYPADHYMLVIGSHGGGWRGIGPDDGDGQESMLELPDIDLALATARQTLGLGKLDIIGFDACLMAVMDVAVMLEPHANYILFSQEVIPSNGWDYLDSISAMQKNPEWDSFQVGSAFIDAYMDYYAGKGGRSKVGLSLVETAGLPNLISALQDFAASVKTDTAALLSALGTARNNSQIFGASLGDRADIYSYIDLRDFMNWFSLQTSISEAAYNAAQAVIAAYDQTVVYSLADSKLPRATGLAVYLPSRSSYYDATYPAAAPVDFAFWQAYLDQFYQTVTTQLDGSSLLLDITNVFTLGQYGSSVDNPVVFFDAAGLGVVDLAYSILYVQSDGTRVVVDASPVSYTTTLPTGETITEYPQELTPSTFTWGVEFPYISDGNNRVLSLLLSNTSSGSELSVSGTYVTAQGSQPAVLVFSADTREYVGILASDGNAVYQPVPAPGDQFVVDLISISPQGEVISQPQVNAPLTFGLEPFTFSYSPAISGVYNIALSMTDLAGNTIRREVELSINNDNVDGTVRGYTDTNEGIYFQYPYAFGEAYSFTGDDGSLTNALSDAASAQNVYIDVFLETDAATALDTVLQGIDGTVSAVTETALGGFPAYSATYTTATEEGNTSSVVYSVANEEAGSVVVLTFTAWGENAEPDAGLIDLVASTMQFFPPLN